jgi:hypothetical protein
MARLNHLRCLYRVKTIERTTVKAEDADCLYIRKKEELFPPPPSWPEPPTTP